ncbi:MAG: hypothetical protein O2820_05160 [Planctomycetota bacterium]|nr:hypothetical protein [Planctomycetota bacterium]MDA1248593.1 hypothetical protein [Planctomycetota bacterium]
MKSTVLTLITGLTLTAGSVLALEENAPGTSELVIKKLLALTDSLQDRVTELENTVDEQKAEIARLKLQQNLSPVPTPKLLFVPETPPTGLKIWQYQIVPTTPATQLNLPPGSAAREINGMRFYIVPCTPETSYAPTATPPVTTQSGVTRVPIHVTVPVAR